MAFAVIEQGADRFSLLVPQEGASIGLQEFRNKLRAFTLFEYTDQVLRLGGRTGPVTDLAKQASQLNPYDAVWATEGIGHYYTEMCFAGGHPPLNLLRGIGAAGVSETALIALHAGMGISLANRALRTIGSRCCGSSLPTALQHFAAMCENNALDGYSGAAHEALGLVARNLHPQLVPAVDRQLAGTNADMREFFWHGVGRALYFTPSSFTPFSSSPWITADLAQHEPPDEAARNNAVSGLVWALALVNIRQPQVLEAFLKYHADRLPAAAVRNGLSSAILVWYDCSPRDGYIGGLLRHRPDASHPSVERHWEELVRRPAEQALAHYYPALREQRQFGGLFRYRNLADWICELATEPARRPPARDNGVPPPHAMPRGGLVEQMIGRPVAAFISGMEMLQEAVGMQTIDGIVSRVVHTLSGAAPLIADCRCGSSKNVGGRHAGTD